MQSLDDSALLRQYAENHSDEAFAALVTRHIDLVYSVAVRYVRDPHLAEEVAQAVFILLAKKATQLRHDKALSSWLFQTTRLTARNLVRSETRRHCREQEAHMQSILNDPEGDIWPRIAPLLDDAVAELNDKDRQAIVLRFYEGRKLQELGSALGASEDAVEKRISRAVEKLRDFFAKRGVTIGGSGLAVVISANAVQAAPVGLATTISTAAALAGITVVTTATTTVGKAIAMTSLQKSLIAVVFVATVGTGIYEARQAARLRDEKQALLAQQEQLTGELNKTLLTTAPDADGEEQLQKHKNELLRLRGEVGVLRNQLSELQQQREQNRQLHALLAKTGQEVQQTPEEKERAQHQQKVKDTKTLALAMINYADRNRGRFPTNFNQVTHYFEQALKDVLNPGDTLRDAAKVFQLTNRFDIVYQGSLQPDLGEVILLREKQPEYRNGKWTKDYGFCDGSTRTIAEPEGGFDVWEAQHIIATPNTIP